MKSPSESDPMITETYTTDEYAALPLEMALMLRAHVKDGKSYQDIVADFVTPLGTVKSRISRARAKISKLRAHAAEAQEAA